MATRLEDRLAAVRSATDELDKAYIHNFKAAPSSASPAKKPVSSPVIATGAGNGALKQLSPRLLSPPSLKGALNGNGLAGADMHDIGSPTNALPQEDGVPHPHRLELATHKTFAAVKFRQDTDWRSDEASALDEQVRSLRQWSLLVVTALLASSLSFIVDQATWLMGVLRNRLEKAGGWDLTSAMAINVLIVILTRLLVRSTPEAEGSGIPEVKTMLFGKKLEKYLTLRVLAVKTIGLTAGVGAGLPLGKEGPFVHLASCITANLDPMFNQMDGAHMTPLLLAACAVGVGTTFSSPLGGVIFAIELMLPQIYDLPSYWGCFVASVCGSVMYAFWKSMTVGATGLMAIMSTDVKPGDGYASAYPMFRLLLDVILGAICGILGGFWVKMHSYVMGTMKRWRTSAAPTRPELHKQPRRIKIGFDLNESLLGVSTEKSWAVDSTTGVRSNRWNVRKKIHAWGLESLDCRDLLQVAAVAAMNTMLAESLTLLQGKPQPLLLSTLFSRDLSVEAQEWSFVSLTPALTLISCFLVKWFMTSFSLALPMPCGVVAPTMIIGALIGRVYVGFFPDWMRDAMLKVTPDTVVTDHMRGSFDARFAIVGAAAFCAGVTRAFAMAITVFEVLALPNSVIPLSCSSLVSIFCANFISHGFFDQLLLNKNFAGVTAISSLKKAGLPASRLMRPIDAYAECMPQVASISCVQRIHRDSKARFFPLVQFVGADSREPLLVGMILRDSVELLLQAKASRGRDTVIDFLDPHLYHKDKQLVNRMPINVGPNTPVKEVYLLMKVVYNEPAVFVTNNGRLLGIIDRDVLLGKSG
mmetsp:Transcript_43617/g.79492  ORF Transcript_43617/g.79492 Transcript_43617/m.79492 type:complete len:813 (+) Transcript_43617:76-2514(+)